MFAGNPAGVCLLPDQSVPDDLLQRIAAENNLAETAFVIARSDHLLAATRSRISPVSFA